MTSSEMKEAFLIGYDKITNSAAKGYLDSEIQFFLNQAQYRVIKKRLPFFELNETIRKELSPLVNGFVYNQSGTGEIEDITTDDVLNPVDLYNSYSKLYKFSSKILKVVSEHAEDSNGNKIEVRPISHDELNKTMKNPFRKPNCKRLVRLDYKPNYVGNSKDLVFHEIISSEAFTISKYLVRFVRYPNDIVMNTTDCELPIQLHQEIVDEAVLLALENAESTRLTNFSQVKQ